MRPSRDGATVVAFSPSLFPFLPFLASAGGTANAVTMMIAAAIVARVLRSISASPNSNNSGEASGVLRPLNELVNRNLRRIPIIHDAQADHAFCVTSVTPGKPRLRHRIKCSAVGTKEGAAFWTWACQRHELHLHSSSQYALSSGWSFHLLFSARLNSGSSRTSHSRLIVVRCG